MKKTFNIAGLKRAGASSEAFIQAILRERPDLKGKDFYVPGTGNMAHTLMTEDEVFKALKDPTNKIDVRNFKKEFRVQRRLSACGAATPALTLWGRQARIFGMNRIHAVALTPDLRDAMSPDERKSLVQDIAAFMVKIENALSPSLAAIVNTGDWQPQERPIRIALANPNVQKFLKNNFRFCKETMAQYLQEMPKRRIGLVHTDLHGHNIMIDPKTKKMAGIIDFGCVDYAVPEACLTDKAVLPLAREICAEYSALSGQEVTYENVVQFKLYHTLIDIHDTLKTGDQQKLKKLARDTAWMVKELRHAVPGKTHTAKIR